MTAGREQQHDLNSGSYRAYAQNRGTVGIQADTAGQRIDVVAAEINADTAISVTAAADVNVTVSRIAGTIVNTGNGLSLSAANLGPVAVSPDGTLWSISVDNAGNLSASAV